MHNQCLYDYAVIRVVPRVEREEFINVGVILSCPTKQFLQAVIELDEQRLLSLYPEVDIDKIKAHLDAIPRVCAGKADAGPIGNMSKRERFHWLVAPRSTMIQLSAVHTGQSDDPARVLKDLVQKMVRT